jgi:UDP-N-acetylglucosamine 2-epimerase (non-hydrolysing)
MKVAPVVHALSEAGTAETLLVHTGQHYDANMSRLFFDELGIPEPDVNLEVGSGTHAAQTAEVMKRLEPVCVEHRPDWVIVVGDVNSTMAGALVATKLGIRVAHVEAGLRSFDRSMPEEINRVVTDCVSDVLLATEPSGVENLRREGVTDGKVHLVGNVMVDTLLRHRAKADESNVLNSLGLKSKCFALVTLHRPSNVDDPNVMTGILDALQQVGTDMPVVFPAHPRTTGNLRSLNLLSRVEQDKTLRMIQPLGYLDFVKLMAEAAVVLTDSGGIQEETTVLGVPCLTLRENTERPITVTQGTNRLTGSDPRAILAGYRAARDNPQRDAQIPDLWDGHAAERIVKVLASV